MLYSVSKGLLMARRKRQKVSHAPESADIQPSPPSLPAAASRVVHDQGVDSPAVEVSQNSRASSHAVHTAVAADDEAPQQPAEANEMASGSKAKRKRMKKLQQRSADADGIAESDKAASDAADASALEASGMLAVTVANGQAEPRVATEGANDGEQQAHVECADSKAPGNGASGVDKTPNGGLALQQAASVSFEDAPRVQSPRASSKRKSVRFHLRDNLFFEPGGQVPPPAVRTPPKAQPKVGQRHQLCSQDP